MEWDWNYLVLAGQIVIMYMIYRWTKSLNQQTREWKRILKLLPSTDGEES